MKLILNYGELSQTDISNLSRSHYSDILNSVKRLVKNKFIESAGEKKGKKMIQRGHRGQKLYKLTLEGLNALYSLPLSNRDFWKITIMLYLNSNDFRAKFEEKYYEKETNVIGYSSKNGYIIDSIRPYELLISWLKESIDEKKFLESQKVLECLGLNRSLSIKQIAKITKIDSIELDNILGYIGNDNNSNDSKSYEVNLSKLDLLHYILILYDNNSNTYELSLFGILLVMAIVRYSSYSNKDNSPYSKLCFLHNNLETSKYFDRIAKNYGDKLPLIFGKWKLLKRNMGRMLYDSFDFMLDKNAPNSFDSSIMSYLYPGNREFYDDFMIMAQNTQRKLSEFYISGDNILEEFKSKNGSSFCCIIDRIDFKLCELKETLNFMDVNDYLREIADLTTYNAKGTPFVQLDITRFEKIFRYELTFLFYINMNMSTSMPNLNMSIDDQKSSLIYELPLGYPRLRLLSILANDKEIKDLLLGWTECIIANRKKSLNLMKHLAQEFSDSETSKIKNQLQEYNQIFFGSKNKNTYQYEYKVSNILK